MLDSTIFPLPGYGQWFCFLTDHMFGTHNGSPLCGAVFLVAPLLQHAPHLQVLPFAVSISGNDWSSGLMADLMMLLLKMVVNCTEDTRLTDSSAEREVVEAVRTGGVWGWWQMTLLIRGPGGVWGWWQMTLLI